MHNRPTGVKATPIFGLQDDLTRVAAGKVRFGSDSKPLILNAEPEWRVRSGQLPNLKPEPVFRFGFAPFNRIQTVVEAKNGDVGKMLSRTSVDREVKPLLKSIHYKNIQIYTKGHSKLQVKYNSVFERDGFPPNTAPEHGARFGHRLNLNLNVTSGPD
ncbi:hypothetical protein K438DRAFT_1779375 [Mycena galopus ATCC 62051]|nr:hypothetical protein K438DRAFT_1779375 [Mycena galopus ATCC 62051]